MSVKGKQLKIAEYKQIHSLVSTGLPITRVASIMGRSATLVAMVKQSKNYGDYRVIRTRVSRGVVERRRATPTPELPSTPAAKPPSLTNIAVGKVNGIGQVFGLAVDNRLYYYNSGEWLRFRG